MHIALIACCKRKLDHPALARELYQGTLFQYSLRYAERIVKPDRIFILSAKYLAIGPYEWIEPYDMTLNTMSAKERHAWGYQVQHKLWFEHGVEFYNHWTVLAGKAYREGLYWLGPPATVYTPLARVGGIGKQIAWLQHQLSAVSSKPKQGGLYDAIRDLGYPLTAEAMRSRQEEQ